MADKMSKFYQPLVGEDMNIRFERVEQIPLTEAGKLKTVISRVAPNN